MNDEAFERLVAQGLDALPPRIHQLMDNVAVTIADDMTLEERQEHGIADDAVIFGFYFGIPLSERGADYSALPDKVTIFKRPILATYNDPDDISACVANTVWHEIAHHFGYDEEWVEEEERKRGKTL